LVYKTCYTRRKDITDGSQQDTTGCLADLLDPVPVAFCSSDFSMFLSQKEKSGKKQATKENSCRMSETLKLQK
jgi:hypothetical protein